MIIARFIDPGGAEPDESIPEKDWVDIGPEFCPIGEIINISRTDRLAASFRVNGVLKRVGLTHWKSPETQEDFYRWKGLYDAVQIELSLGWNKDSDVQPMITVRYQHPAGAHGEIWFKPEDNSSVLNVRELRTSRIKTF